MRVLYSILILCIVISGAHAESKIVGNWRVIAEPDRFSERINVVVMTFSSGGGPAFRCLDGELSIALGEMGTKYREDDVFGVELRVDRQPIVQTSGTAIGPLFIEVTDQASDIIKELRSASELAVRVSGEVARKTIVFSLAKVSIAIAPLLKACPPDMAPAVKRNDGLTNSF